MLILMAVCLCSAAFGAMGRESQLAVDGAYTAFASAIASYYSDPKVGLQGVTFDSLAGPVPGEISFVRSDISTYQGSFGFFADDTRSTLVMAIINGFMQGHSMALSAGELVVDGTMRVTGSSGITPELGASGNWDGAELRFTASLALDGKLLSHGIIVEGSFRIIGMENRSIELETEYFKVDGVEYSLLDAVYSF